MARKNSFGEEQALPPRIKAAFDYLEHLRMISFRMDISMPVRELSALEKAVQTAALRAVQSYLLGEMDFAEKVVESDPKKNKDAGDATPASPAS